jgi:hypothetical protein
MRALPRVSFFHTTYLKLTNLSLLSLCSIFEETKANTSGACADYIPQLVRIVINPFLSLLLSLTFAVSLSLSLSLPLARARALSLTHSLSCLWLSFRLEWTRSTMPCR